jgi:hypothetical protein
VLCHWELRVLPTAKQTDRLSNFNPLISPAHTLSGSCSHKWKNAHSFCDHQYFCKMRHSLTIHKHLGNPSDLAFLFSYFLPVWIQIISVLYLEAY